MVAEFALQGIEQALEPGRGQQLDLATGGLTQGGQFNCRFLASDLSTPPKRGESVLYAGRSYLINEVKQLVHSSAEHVCVLTPGSLQ